MNLEMSASSIQTASPTPRLRAGNFFEEHHLLESIRARLGEAASQVQSGVLADIAAFSDGTDQFDDIALVILRRLP